MKHIKHLIPLALFVFQAWPGTMTAQKTGTQILADELCKWAKGYSTNGKAKTDVEQDMGMMLGGHMMVQVDLLSKEYNFKPEALDDKIAENISQKVGIQASRQCPNELMPILHTLSGNPNAPTQAGEVIVATENTGTFVKLDFAATPFTKVVVKNNTGAEETYYWIRPFTGDKDLGAKHKTMTGKSIKVTTADFTYYDAKTNQYITLREVKAVKW